MRVHPSTASDYRTMTALLRDNTLTGQRIEFHTYELKEQKNLRIITRGLPCSIPTEDIYQELEQLGFEPIKITRLTKGRGENAIPMPLHFVLLAKTDNAIYNLKWLCNTNVKIESKRLSNTITQCYRCQRYGHAQRFCHADPRCVGFAEPHFSWQCENKPRPGKAPTFKPKCCLCGGTHPANYKIKRN